MSKGIYKKIGIGLFVFLILFSYSPEYSRAQTTGESKDVAELRLKYLQYTRELEEARAGNTESFNFGAVREAVIRDRFEKQNAVASKLEAAIGKSAFQSLKESTSPKSITNVGFANGSKLTMDNQGGITRGDTYTKIEGTENAYWSNNPNFKDQVFTIEISKTTGEYEITSATDGTNVRNFGSTDATRAQQRADDVEIVCYAGVGTLQNVINPLCYLAKFSYYVVFNYSALFLSISGGLFNFVVTQTVVQMAELIKDDIINQGWTLFRDIINILFIFVLIYAAIRTILKGTSDTGKTIVTVIVVAVLINFSLFFTKVIIDISNTLAISFYNSITKIPLLDANKKPIVGVNNDTKYGIAEVFLTQTNMTTIVGTNPANVQWGVASLTYLGIIKQTLISSIFIVILAVVLMIMSLMLITRFLILMFVMISSSLAFGSYILPKLQSKVADKWWPALIGQAFFVPVFFLMLYITLKFSQSLSFEKGSGFANVAHILPGQLVTYVLVVGMLILSMKVAKSMADEAGAASGKITGFLGGAALGVTGALMRNTVGGTAGWLSNKIGDPKSATGLLMKRMLDGTAKSSFDGRNIAGVSSLLKTTGVDFGKASKENYEDAQKKREIAAGKRAKMMSNEVDPTDPEGRTYREIYQTRLGAAFIGRGDHAVRAKRLAHNEEKKEAEKKANDAKNKRGVLSQDKENHLQSLTDGGKTHAQHNNDLKKAKDELEVLKAAKAQAIAAGNNRYAAQIQNDIDKENTNKADAEAAIKRMEEATNSAFKDRHEALEKEIDAAVKSLEEVKKAGNKIGAEEEVSQKDLLKALKERKKDDD